MAAEALHFVGSEEPLRLGLVGCGRLAERAHLPAIDAIPGARLAAVADPDHERAAACGASRRFKAIDELLGAGDVDALIVCSPAQSHPHAAELAAAAGLPCLVEKPPAPDLAGAERIAALQPAPWIGFNRRYMLAPSVRPVVPEDGPLEIDLELAYRRASWAAHEVRDDALLDLGTHLVDLARLLSDSEIVSVGAPELTPERASLTLDLGERGGASIRVANDGVHRESIEVRLEGRRVARAAVGGRLMAIGGRMRRGPHPLQASIARQLVDFCRVARGGEAPALGTARDGLAAMAAIDAARSSARSGGAPVEVGTADAQGVAG
jgi:predicted dehydrogenase